MSHPYHSKMTQMGWRNPLFYDTFIRWGEMFEQIVSRVRIIVYHTSKSAFVFIPYAVHGKVDFRLKVLYRITITYDSLSNQIGLIFYIFVVSRLRCTCAIIRSPDYHANNECTMWELLMALSYGVKSKMLTIADKLHLIPFQKIYEVIMEFNIMGLSSITFSS